ncbi:MAG TPA: TonB-dependent receptor [Blastocatellia bacterium]|nr:TonB-dependent receptor [Blastocatellia bacterium]
MASLLLHRIGRYYRTNRPDSGARFAVFCTLLATLVFIRAPVLARARARCPALTRNVIQQDRQSAGQREAQQTQGHKQPDRSTSVTSGRLSIRVVDENNVVVASAQVTLEASGIPGHLSTDTDLSGRAEFDNLPPGLYSLRIERQGFYAKTLDNLGPDQRLEVTLDHQQELKESMSVVYSPPAIDPQETATTETLTGKEIIDLPFPTSRDIKRALPLMPSVVSDVSGQVHVAGSRTQQTQDELDGFNITQPLTGLLSLHVSTDAVRAIDVQTSRYSAAYGKGSGGVIGLATGMGDDHYRFSATNFIPSVQNNKGIALNDWTPRATVSGPMGKGKAWFYDAADGQYKLNIVSELPIGQDRSSFWEVSNLSRAQVNLSSSNILSSSFLFNRFHEANNGLSRFTPLQATVDLRQSAYLVWLKDQDYLSNGVLLEAGMALYRYKTHETSHGTAPYDVLPDGNLGSFFKTLRDHANRFQWIASAALPPLECIGRHDIQIGLDLDRITFVQVAGRRPTFVLREDGTLARSITFEGNQKLNRDNFETSAYAQDRWAPRDRLVVEAGLRLDRDQIISGVSVSPRLAAAYILAPGSETKVSAGVGLFYDATNLDFITRPLDMQRLDLFYGPDGKTRLGPPVGTSFTVNEQSLRRPRSLNLSAGLDRKLPGSIYMRINFMDKRGADGFTFVNSGSAPKRSSGRSVAGLGGRLLLQNLGRDRYKAVELTLRRPFKQGHEVLVSYTRSSARSNAVVDFQIDNPIFSQQAGGPLPWDTPNRLVSWAILPLVKKFDLTCVLEWRDGFPFSVVNQNQALVGPPGSHRFPFYFSLSPYLERRVRVFGAEWALRGGFDNVTNQRNPGQINNNINSPQFLTLGATQHRSFTARIRFLGRK